MKSTGGAVASAPKDFAPFSKHKDGGVAAKGRVSEIRTNDDGKTVRVTVRHEPPADPKAKKDPTAFTHYAPETSATMPAASAKALAHGQHVTVHIKPVHGADAAGEPDADDAGKKRSPIRRAGK